MGLNEVVIVVFSVERDGAWSPAQEAFLIRLAAEPQTMLGCKMGGVGVDTSGTEGTGVFHTVKLAAALWSGKLTLITGVTVLIEDDYGFFRFFRRKAWHTTPSGRQ